MREYEFRIVKETLASRHVRYCLEKRVKGGGWWHDWRRLKLVDVSYSELASSLYTKAWGGNEYAARQLKEWLIMQNDRLIEESKRQKVVESTVIE